MLDSRGGAMRLCTLLLLSLLTIGVAAPLGAEDKSDEAKVRDLEKKWTDSYKHRKIELLSSLLADDFVITVEDGNTYSKPGYITHSADPSVHVEIAELSDLKVHIHGNAAVVTGPITKRANRTENHTSTTTA
jgi:ketosteroid isomerase-like protein